MVMRSTFPPRQQGWRYPRHQGLNDLTAAGTHGMLAALPVFRGESLAGYNGELVAWTSEVQTFTRAWRILIYGAYFPYMWGLSGTTLDEAAILEMAAEHVWDPLQNVGGDPDGAIGATDAEDWMGEDEVSGAEIFHRDWFHLIRQPRFGSSESAGDFDVYQRVRRVDGRRNRYFGQDGIVAFWFGWAANPQDQNNLGIEVMDASINPAVLQEMAEGGLPGGEDAVNQVRELVYGGDAFGDQPDHGGAVYASLKLDTTIKTPYPLPGNRF